jgi:hypothetical protein
LAFLLAAFQSISESFSATGLTALSGPVRWRLAAKFANTEVPYCLL